ncbi:PAS domain-containing protein [Agrobacterium sp. BA1120]|uniref:PAS domain-containing protein n=1 Tax=Agrobacterium sp. BA1120 TaxID=3228927 RepID=UPI00336A89D3
MDFQTSQQRRWFAFATICFGLRWGVAMAIFMSAAAAALIWAEGDLASLSISGWSVYAKSAFGIWAVITSYRTISFYDQVYKTVRPTLEDIPGLSWSAFPDGRMRFVNPAATEFVGITREEMKKRAKGTDTAWWIPFVYPDDRERSLALWRNRLKTGEPLSDEQRVRRFDGTYRWFRDFAIASRDENRKITAWYGSTVDVTDKRTLRRR